LGWSGCAPTWPAIGWLKALRQGARHVPAYQQCSDRDRLDIGKNSFHVVGLDDPGAMAWSVPARGRGWLIAMALATYHSVNYQHDAQ
jgi:hypothetical protein